MANAQTRKFNVSIMLGDKTYGAGESVKIGKAKDAISSEEADQIDHIHGAYAGGKVEVASSINADRIVELELALETEKELSADLSKQLDDLKSERSGDDETDDNNNA